MDPKILLYIIFFLFIFEFFLILLIKNLKKDFKWLINSDDEKPHFDKKKLKNFYKNSFDQLLGWDRKKNTNGFEISTKRTFFNIKKNGNRGKSKFKKTKISVFGDSFAFCRYVNDDETWESYIEERIKYNVHNFGVGNFGLDQSYLKYVKLKRNISSKIIIFNFVPETIARVNSYWKHYREFGNIMAFKPLFIEKKNNLFLKKIIIKKNFSQKKIHSQLKGIKKFDIFYDLKFNREKFVFPYTITFLKNIKTSSTILSCLIFYKLLKKKKFYDKAVTKILFQNISQSHKMYNDIFLASKLKKIIFMMNKQIQKDKKKMILIISPQLLDLKSDYIKYPQTFFSKLPKEIICLDLSKYMNKKKNFQKFYLEDKYGGHLNKIGNKYISKVILKFLRKSKIL